MTGSVLTAAVLAAASLAVLLLPRSGDRLRTAVGDPPAAGAVREASDRGPDGAPPRPSPAALACGLVGVALALLVAPPVGPVLGLGAAVVGPRLLSRLEPQAVRTDRERLAGDLPLVLDLLAACLAGGAPQSAAAEAVGTAVGGTAGRRLHGVVAALAVGAPPAEAWAVLAGGSADDPWAPAARALSRAADGGAPVATAVHRLAAEARAEARSTAEQAARRVGVLAVAPLTVCFLPAFVLLGVVPVVVSLASPLLATLQH